MTLLDKEADEVPSTGGARSYGAADIVGLLKSPSFQAAKLETRTAAMDAMVSSAFDTESALPTWNQDAYQSFGRLAAAAHKKAGATPWESTKQWLD